MFTVQLKTIKMTKQAINITIGQFEPKQILHIRNVNGNYTINKVTDKAILIECDNGNWIDNGKFIPVWLPKSQLTLIKVNSNPDNSQYGMHIVDIPEWLVNSNSKKW